MACSRSRTNSRSGETSRTDITLTDGNGADVIYNPVGGGYTDAALRAIA